MRSQLVRTLGAHVPAVRSSSSRSSAPSSGHARVYTSQSIAPAPEEQHPADEQQHPQRPNGHSLRFGSHPSRPTKADGVRRRRLRRRRAAGAAGRLQSERTAPLLLPWRSLAAAAQPWWLLQAWRGEKRAPATACSPVCRRLRSVCAPMGAFNTKGVERASAGRWTIGRKANQACRQER